MQDVKIYKIFWNNKQPDFWKYHDAFCKKFGVPLGVSANYVTECELSEEQIALFKKAIESGFIRIVKI